jgi:regulatory protein
MLVQMEGMISRLERKKAGRNRVKVCLGDRASFTLALALAGQLSVGQYLTEVEVDSLLQEDSYQSGLDIAFRLLAYRPRSQKEIDRHLQKRGVDAEVRDAVLVRLESNDLVDDEAFASYWVENRERFAPRSHRALRHELRAKGVSMDIIHRVLEDVDEEDSAYRAADAKMRKLGSLDGNASSDKLKRHLGRRGFSYSIVRAAVDRLFEEGRDQGLASRNTSNIKS